MQTQCTQQTFEFQALGRREVVARFDGGPITSDAGGLLLREVEQHTGIMQQETPRREPALRYRRCAPSPGSAPFWHW